MKLYSGPLSLFTAKVRIALDEKALPYERIEVGWSLADRYLPHHPEVVRLNPKAQVPVLVDDDVVVYDSTQIFEYLEDRHPQPALYPQGASERARCRRLEAFADEIVFPHVWELIAGGFYPAAADGGQSDDRLLPAKSELRRLQAEIDAELTGRETLCARYSVADIAVFIMLTSAATLGAPAPETCANLRAWQARVGARPAVKREFEALLSFAATTRAAAG
jgi:glutathione S-transferase